MKNIKNILVTVLVFISAFAFSQGVQLRPTVNAGTLEGHEASYFVDTLTAQDVYGIKTWLANPVIKNATPILNFKDSDATAGDVNSTINVDATDVGDGTEDVDWSVYQQVNGTLLRTIFSDADQGIWLYPLGESANPISITTGGNLTATTYGTVAPITDTELSYVDGAASNIQTQITKNVDSLAVHRTDINTAFKAVDATNISSVVFTMLNGDTIRESFGHLHTEYALVTNTIPLTGGTFTGDITVEGTVKSDSLISTGGVYGDTARFIGYVGHSDFTIGNAASGVTGLTFADGTEITSINTTGTAANLSGTPALPDGVTATTQSASDNSTKLATTAYADAVATSSLWTDDGSQTYITIDSEPMELRKTGLATGFTAFGNTDAYMSLKLGDADGGFAMNGMVKDAGEPAIEFRGVTTQATPTSAPMRFGVGKQTSTTWSPFSAGKLAFNWNNSGQSLMSLNTSAMLSLGDGSATTNHQLSMYDAAPNMCLTDIGVNLNYSTAAQSQDTNAVWIRADDTTPEIGLSNSTGDEITMEIAATGELDITGNVDITGDLTLGTDFKIIIFNDTMCGVKISTTDTVRIVPTR